MSRAIYIVLLAIGVAAAGYAIEPGNTEKQVLAVLGKPNATRNTPNGVLWKFKDGTSVLLEAGVVREVDGPGVAKEVPAPAAVEAPASDPVATRAATADVPPGAMSASPARVIPKNTSAGTPANVTPANKTSPLAPIRVTPMTVNVGTRNVGPPPAKSGPMRYVGFAIVAIATLLLVVCKVMVLVVAFKEGMAWGLACIFVPLVTLIFIIMHWDDTKKILAYQFFAGVPLLLLGVFMLARA